MQSAFVFIILADVSARIVAQAPQWQTPKNTTLILDTTDVKACDLVTTLRALSANKEPVQFTLVPRNTSVGFSVVYHADSGEDVLRCNLQSITEPEYTVVVRAQHIRGSSEYSDLTLHIYVKGLSTTTQVIMDPCASNPCENGGECIRLMDKKSCSCKPGFDGKNCEIDIDDCRNNPCLNGGTCVDGIDSYRCNCKQGTEGTSCQTVHGGLSLWTTWSTCTVTCGDGLMTRKRLCNNPAPSGDGRNCSVGYIEMKQCSYNTCQTDDPKTVGSTCQCMAENYWDGTNCIAKATICSSSCDTTAYIVMVIILSLVVVTLAVYAIYLTLATKRNAGKLGITTEEKHVELKDENPKYVNVAYVEDEKVADKHVDIPLDYEEVNTQLESNKENDTCLREGDLQDNIETDRKEEEEGNEETNEQDENVMNDEPAGKDESKVIDSNEKDEKNENDGMREDDKEDK